MQRCALAFVLIALAAGTVAAQPMAGSPTFATMDRGDGESKIGASLGWTFFDSDGPGDVSALRVDVYGHYVGMSGLGGYGVVPLSFVFVDDDPIFEDEDESAIGNVEGGVLYVIPSGSTDFVLRGGITLPTADDDGTGIATNFLATWPRLTDIAHYFPETFWLRLSASPIFRSGQFIARLDGGVDFALSTDNYDEPDPVLRLNVGAGVDTGSFAILGELVTIGNLGDDDSAVDTAPDEDYLHTLALSARFRAGSVEPGIALGFPLDEAVRDFMDFFIIGSLQGRI